MKHYKNFQSIFDDQEVLSILTQKKKKTQKAILSPDAKVTGDY